MTKKSKVKGYVYILTNKSFRENWVKIGRSKGEVNVRSKRLSNTAIPLPFETYASIKTAKYIEVEQHLHKILTDLAHKRVNPKREFFDIAPEKAFEYLQSCAQMIEDAELELYNNLDEDLVDTVKNQLAKFHKKGKYTVNTNEKFKFARETTDATMIVKDGKRYIVLKGSRIDRTIYSREATVKRLRSTYAKYLKHDITTKDIEFASPSSAGVFVGGGACNGKFYWRTKNGKPLNDFIKYNKKK